MKRRNKYYRYTKKQKRIRKLKLAGIIALVVFALAATFLLIKWYSDHRKAQKGAAAALKETSYTVQRAESFETPEYAGDIAVEINGNVPFFEVKDLILPEYEQYSSLDESGRCGPAIACLSMEMMPEEERGAIGMIKPSGWHTVRYDDIIEDKYLFNRCHLISFALAGENDNDKNLITGTRFFNVSGMLPYEIKVADYLRDTGNHVFYRVTPVFVGDNLVASGVLMEAQSVEDDKLIFNVFIHNVQPGIKIDYATGESERE